MPYKSHKNNPYILPVGHDLKGLFLLDIQSIILVKGVGTITINNIRKPLLLIKSSIRKRVNIYNRKDFSKEVIR